MARTIEHHDAPGLRAMIVYWSASGNTKKVAEAVQRGLMSASVQPMVRTVAEAGGIDLYDYDLVFFGAPSYSFLPPEPVLRYVKEKIRHHRDRGDIKPGAPKVPGKRAIVFVTYSGPHTGIDEAIPVGKYLGQFFAHIGFDVLHEWYIVGEFHGREDLSTLGRLGDIRGRPSIEDLANVERQAAELVLKGP
ncbi:MAG: flavodoxin domain-containing protein [Bacteroidetes bacterium]|nr:flavodoxin domain-containing protein [Bacteroidota bacterium]MCL5024991.1 flavodoxin domain-containing protein [Chloroflexota bacterium]